MRDRHVGRRRDWVELHRFRLFAVGAQRKVISNHDTYIRATWREMSKNVAHPPEFTWSLVATALP